MTKDEVIERLCKLTTKVMRERFAYNIPADCFCEGSGHDPGYVCGPVPVCGGYNRVHRRGCGRSPWRGDTNMSLLTQVKAQGGITIDPDTGIPVEKSLGFYVSVPGYESSLTLDPIHEEEFDTAVEIYSQIARRVNRLLFVGVWIDDGQVYFDLSEYVYEKDVAVVLGHRRGQKAIFDCSTKQSIYL